MGTAHIESNKNDIAKIVLMSGDPLRARYYAEKFLTNFRLVNKVRGILAYTGKINNIEVTVMGHGMGLDSIGIYAYELYKFYDVEIIMRLGSCGSYNKNINLYDLIVAQNAYSYSNYGMAYNYSKNIVEADKDLVLSAQKIIQRYNISANIHFTTVNSSMWFYDENPEYKIDEYVEKGIDVVEMESFALYIIAKFLNRKALTILTVSDHLVFNKSISAKKRENTFNEMFDFAIKIIEDNYKWMTKI